MTCVVSVAVDAGAEVVEEDDVGLDDGTVVVAALDEVPTVLLAPLGWDELTEVAAPVDWPTLDAAPGPEPDRDVGRAAPGGLEKTTIPASASAAITGRAPRTTARTLSGLTLKSRPPPRDESAPAPPALPSALIPHTSVLNSAFGVSP